MQDLDPIKIYTVREMRELCKEKGVKYSQIIKSRTATSNCYGMIIKEVDGKCQLYPELIDTFNKYFNYTN